jgi:hypothetical protein
VTTPASEDEFTELVDFHPDRVDLVGKAANGTRFLIAKGAEPAGLLAPEFVRGLVAKTSVTEEAPVSQPAEAGETALPNGIVLKGSPAAMAAFIHAASVRKEEAPREDAVTIAKTAAEYERILKAKYSAEDKRKMLAQGHAIKNENGDPAYPIGDKDDVDKAVHAVGRGGPDHDHIRAYIIRRAKALGASSMIPDNWNADGSLKSGVSKEAGVPDQVSKDAAGDSFDDQVDGGTDGLDPTVPMAAPDGLDSIPGDPMDPGSPAWESVDAATAAKWTAILAGARRAVDMLRERELLEAASVDPDDAENACDLATVCDAIDYAISVLAPFVVCEQSEADAGAADFQAIGKAATGAEQPAQLITGLVSVAKAGRALSAVNEGKIRSAAQALTEVLASLPQAPDAGGPAAVTKEGTMPHQNGPAAVAKETASPEQQAADKGPEPSPGTTTGLGEPRVTGPDGALPADGPQQQLPGDVPGRSVVKSALPVAVYNASGRLTGITPADAIVQKADGDGTEMMAVFDAAGNLCGVVDFSQVVPVTVPGADEAGADEDGSPDEDAEPEMEGEPQAGLAAAGAPDAADLEPQPSADAGTPAEDVAKSGDPKTGATGMQDVVKTVEQVKEFLERSEAAHQEVVAKMAADKDVLAAELKEVRKRLETVENTPAMPKVALNGAVPPAQLRGQDQGAPVVDVAKAAELRQTLYTGSGPEQAKAFHEMEGMAIAKFAQIRAGAPASPVSPAAS